MEIIDEKTAEANKIKQEFFETINITDILGIGEKVEAALNDINIFSIVDLAIADAEMVATLGKMKKETAISFILGAQRLLRKRKALLNEFCTMDEVSDKRKEVLKVVTGSKDFDTLLFGGIETMALTEVFGEFGAGKSQLCHTLCVNATLPIEEGGLNSNSLYIDTEGTFRLERIIEIAKSKGMDVEKIKNSIRYCKIFNSSHLELIIRELGGTIEKHKPKLVVIDSIISLHRAEYTGRGMLAERQQRLNPMLHHIIRLAELYNVAFVMTNQVQSDPSAQFGDPIKPAGGNIIGHVSTYRIYLRRSGKSRTARIIDSPYHPYSDVKFKVTEKGIEDLSDKEKKNDSE